MNKAEAEDSIHYLQEEMMMFIAIFNYKLEFY